MNGRGYIGGSAISGILGISPFQTPMDVYFSVVEGREVIDPEKQAFFEDRKALEPWAMAKFCRKTGLQAVSINQRYDDAEYPWAKAEIDFETSSQWNVESKTVRESMAWMWDPSEDGNEPPFYVTAQAQWGLGVRPAIGVFVNACIGFDDHDVYELPKDDALIMELRERAKSFWTHHIEKRRMPQPASLEDVLKLYGRDSGRVVEATNDILQAMDARSKAVHKLKLAETEKLDAELTIKKFMRDATTLTRNGVCIATWKSNVRGIRVFNCK